VLPDWHKPGGRRGRGEGVGGRGYSIKVYTGRLCPGV